ncbi:ATP-binding protein [Thermoleptolyngbya oregonensis NK1-22]|uniref:ATP-binding protein n=1 Tax=Thermoleptolyngbya oregonensis NK1-22 TaxID=2547457 RepID=A0AA97BKQ5_9CYAN|nr:ATP-binding protein [Thermoleptolyngbya oregonensis]WOB42207.1 ATP-binding protein [Thermoleptolyngbya oregonensis NK1-22]
MNQMGTLIFFCGKMGSGKSTLSCKIAKELNAILLSEDEWLSTIYPEEIKNFDDYVKYSRRLRSVLKNHVRSIIKAGISVVMDFPANTVNQRAWFKEILLSENIPHQLIYLDVDDETCLEGIRKRRETNPERSQFDTEDVFHHVTSFFQPPSVDEGFWIEVIHRDVL